MNLRNLTARTFELLTSEKLPEVNVDNFISDKTKIHKYKN